MRSQKHEREVERALREAMKADKARATVGRISPNGLLEINRQRIKQALQLRTHRPCPTCGGTGNIPSPEFVGVNLLRRIEARAAGGRLGAARVGLHPELADAIQNFRRHDIAALEDEFDMRIEIIAMTSLHRSDEKVEWIQREAGEAALRPVPVVTAADVAIAAPELPEEGPPGKTGEKRHKRRRGGRRHRKSGLAPSNGTEPAAVAKVPVNPAPVGAESSTTQAAGTKTRKRRRHRRRGKAKGAAAEAQS